MSSLIDFEQLHDLAPCEAARLLGVSNQHYSMMRAGVREVQPYIAFHIETLSLLSPAKLETLMQKRLCRNRKK